MIMWFWLAATLGTVVLSVLGLATTTVLSVILFRRSEKFHAIAGAITSLTITIAGIWAYNTLI